MRTRQVSIALFAIVLITTSSLLIGAPFTLARGQLGLVKAYGPGTGSAQPYEPVGPWIDGIQIPQFLSNQNNEWSALKAGTIDLYDWPLRPSQIVEYHNNPCIVAPDAPAGIAPCGAGLAPLQHEITLMPVQAFNKFQIDMQNTAFPTNLLAFRQAVALAFDKEQFITNVLGGEGAPNYGIVGCPALCGPGADGVFNTADDLWVKPTLNEAGLTCLSVAGPAMPFTAGGHCNAPAGTLDPARVTAANALLDSLGFASRDSLGLRLDNGPGCASRTVPNGLGSLITINDCGKELQPVFYVRLDDSSRLLLGRQLQVALQNSLGIDMDIGGSTKYTGDFRNYAEPDRTLFTSVFGRFAYNLFTGGWFLSRDPTYIDDLYDSQFTKPFQANYPQYSDPIFDTYARGLRTAETGPSSDPFANARSFAYAAELEFNATVPVVDIWTDTAPHAIRIFHADSDPVLNGLSWEGFQNQVGVGPHNGFSWLTLHLAGAPLHDPNHPVFIKWGWKTDLLDSPNPVDSFFFWDSFADGLTYDQLNNLATDDTAFTSEGRIISGEIVQLVIGQAVGERVPEEETVHRVWRVQEVSLPSPFDEHRMVRVVKRRTH